MSTDNTDQILAEFKKHGDKASFHYADDSTSEWELADKAKLQALALFDAHPELRLQMREIGRGFLWLLGMERPRSQDPTIPKETQ